jgi:hypothetical protein
MGAGGACLLTAYILGPAVVRSDEALTFSQEF